jgi:hypothetical protein
MDRAMKINTRANAFVEQQGAVNARFFALTGGTNVGLYASAWEFEDMRGYARAQQAFVTEPEGQAIATQGQGADAASVLVANTVWTEIPL